MTRNQRRLRLQLPDGPITPDSEVVVRDYGHGLSAEEIQKQFLPIGVQLRGKGARAERLAVVADKQEMLPRFEHAPPHALVSIRQPGGTGSASVREMFRVLFILLAVVACRAANPGALTLIPVERLSDRSFSTLAQRALAVRAADWKHAETEHFALHFSDEGTAAAVAVEVEFYYRVIAEELGRDTARWERKGHVFLFHEDADWKEFQRDASLDPWSGGIHAGGTIFLLRNAGWKARAQTLPHEIAHLVFDRFVGSGVPLWLNEGFAEYAAGRCMAAFYRARGFNSRPRVAPVAAADFIPLAALTSAAAYPAGEDAVIAFYNESEKLVRFLAAADKAAFFRLLDEMGKGAKFESAMARSFGSKFPSLDALEREFKPYATTALRPN